jgi:toxin CcdB
LDGLIRFDVAIANGTLYVVVESELMPHDRAIVVIPLLTDYPAARHLNPIFDFDGRRLVLATRLIVSVRRSALRRVGTVAEQSDLVVRALHTLLSGV